MIRPQYRRWLLLAGMISFQELGATPQLPANTLPTAPTVTAGQVQITTPEQGRMNIDQSSTRSNISWQSFSIGGNAEVRFNLPSHDSIAVNRVSGRDASVIAGKLSSNGQIFISNPNGILFTRSSRVETGGLLATSHQLSQIDSEGRLSLSSPGAGGVENLGTISSRAEGFVVLAGIKVSNQGTISTPAGTTAMAAGEKIDLRLGHGIPVDIKVTRGHIDALVENSQAIIADGGSIIMTAKGADQTLSAAVNNTGTLQARTVERKNGRILLTSDGTMKAAGSLDASAPAGGDGGLIETSAPVLSIDEGISVTTKAAEGRSGTWLIDPIDFTISSGTAALSTSGIGASVLSASLELGNVAIATAPTGAGNGDIYVNAPVSWAANNKLTLSAHGNIIVNSPITASGPSGSVMFEFGLGAIAAGNLSDYIVRAPVNLRAGNNFSTRHGSDGAVNQFRVITALGTFGDSSGLTLQGLQPYLNTYPPFAHIAIGADIDASVTSAWDSGRGFLPLDGSYMQELTGLGHRIDGLHISRTSTPYVGLFSTSYGIIKDLGITNAYISGRSAVGPFAGAGGETAFINCYTSNCEVRSNSNGQVAVGGIAGQARYVADSYAENVFLHASNGNGAGGIVAATGNSVVGGRLGNYPGDTITRCWSSGIVHGLNELGGIIGNNSGSISNCYSLAYVYSDNNSSYVGGIAGKNWYSTISNSHSMSNIVGTSQGFFGQNYFTNCYAAYQSAQFVYPNNGTTVTGINVISGSNRAQSSYTNFDFTNTWWMKEGFTRPMLRSEARNYITNSHQLQLVAMQPTGNYVLRYDLDLTNDLIDNLAYYRNIWSGQGFASLGDAATPFTGSFDGAGHTINSLVIDTPSADGVGLFGTVNGGSISNLTLTAGSVRGNLDVGLLIGLNNDGIISQAHSNGTTTGSGRVGGLIGRAIGSSTVSDSSAKGVVNSSGSSAGGLIGENNSAISSINRSFSTNTVNGTTQVGGLVGYLVGDIYDAYARGNVNSTSEAGGLIGRIDGGTVSRVYSRGRVSGTSSLGGLVGVRNGTTNFSHAYWELESSYQASSPAGTSFTYSIKTRHSTYAGFDFVDVWGISVNLSYDETYPELRSLTSGQYLQTPLFVRANAGTSVYGETPGIGYGLFYRPDGTGQSVTGLTITGTPTWTGSPTNLSPAGSYSISYNNGLSITSGSGYYAVLSENPASWLVTPRPVTLTATSASKTYGNLDPSFAYMVQPTSTGVGLTNGDSASGTLGRAPGESVGTYAINQGSLSVTNSSNYAITFAPSTLTIGQRAITLAAASTSKTYGDIDPLLGASITAGSLGSVTVSDSLSDLTGTLNRASGESVGNYAISLGSGTKASNYAITYVPANLSIGRRAISLSANAASKTYGNSDPVLGVSITSGSLGSATVTDTLSDITGVLSRAAGNSVGQYAISLGAGTKASNYLISYAPNDLTVLRRPINISAIPTSKTINQADPVLSFGVEALNGNRGLILGDNIIGTLARTTGETPGTYAISQGTVNNASNDNYDISFLGSAFTINASLGVYKGLEDQSKTLEAEMLTRPGLPQDDQTTTSDYYSTVSGEDAPSDVWLRPADVRKARPKRGSRVTVQDGGVRLPANVIQLFYQGTQP
jgi:filamentous hemagglutinin family protein